MLPPDLTHAGWISVHLSLQSSSHTAVTPISLKAWYQGAVSLTLIIWNAHGISSTRNRKNVGNAWAAVRKSIQSTWGRGYAARGLHNQVPSAKWQLRLGPTLLALETAYKGYLGSIFTGVKKTGFSGHVLGLLRFFLRQRGCK